MGALGSRGKAPSEGQELEARAALNNGRVFEFKTVIYQCISYTF